MMDVITYPCLYQSCTILVEGAPGINFNPNMPNKKWDEITSPFQNLNDCTVEVGGGWKNKSPHTL